MSQNFSDTPYRFLVTRPELPGIQEWTPYLTQAYEGRWYTNFGPVSRALENQLNTKWGNQNSAFVVTSSGTASLTAPLIAQGITGPVILPAFTFPATLSAIKMAGAKPVIFDVDENSWRVSAKQLDAAFRASNAKAAIVVSPFGLKSSYTEHIDVAKTHNATLIIDNAAGLGIEREQLEDNENVFEAFSMHATKPFGIGEGGLIVSNRKHEAALRSALNFGLNKGLEVPTPTWGINGKMSEIHAAIGLAVLDQFDERVRYRQRFAQQYIERLPAEILNPHHHDPENSAWQVLPILMETKQQASALVKDTHAKGMEVRRYYRPSLSNWPDANTLGPCPVSESLADRMCCLPIYSIADQQEINEMTDLVTKSIRTVLGRT